MIETSFHHSGPDSMLTPSQLPVHSPSPSLPLAPGPRVGYLHLIMVVSDFSGRQPIRETFTIQRSQNDGHY
jgi:hypothetical protein